MEFAAYLMVTLACVLLLYWSTHNTTRKPGTPITGLFTYREGAPSAEGGTPGRDGAGAPKRDGEPSGEWRGLR